MRRFARTVCFMGLALLAISAAGLGKDDEKKDEKKNPEDFRYDVAVERVEVDVLVQDKDDNFVSGLKPEDFEVTEEGNPVKILDFEERSLVPETSAAPAAPVAAPSPAPAAAAAPASRKFIIFADLLNTSLASVQSMKRYLMRFVGEVLRPTDQVMVAALAADGHLVVIQPFTDSKPFLIKAINSLQGNVSTESGERSLERDLYSVLYPNSPSHESGILARDDSSSLEQMLASIETGIGMVKDFSAEQYRRIAFSLGSVAMLIEKVEEAHWQSGRKTVIYISDGLPIRPGQSLVDVVNRRIEEYNRKIETQNNPNAPSLPRAFPIKADFDLRDDLRTTVGRLNRFGATLYSIDARGVFQDASSDPSRPRSNLSVGEQQAAFFESQEVLSALAVDTGGIPYYNRSNYDAPLREIEQDNRKRYFLTYAPPEHKKGKKAKFYEIEVKCKKPGVSVRARKGYLD
jgi:VWFA-related protein